MKRRRETPGEKADHSTWHFVLFIEDWLHDAVPASSLREGPVAKARWRDRKWYPVEVLRTGTKEEVVKLLLEQQIANCSDSDLHPAMQEPSEKGASEESPPDLPETQPVTTAGVAVTSDDSDQRELIDEPTTAPSSCCEALQPAAPQACSTASADAIAGFVEMSSQTSYVPEAAPVPAYSDLQEEESEVLAPESGGVSLASISGKRVWDKKFQCIYCKKLVCKLPRHWYTKHAEETEVARIMSLAKNSERRERLIDELRSRSTYLANTECIRRGVGSAVPKRRPQKSCKKSLEDFIPCKFCRQLFAKKYVAVHQGKCKLGPEAHSDSTVPFRNRNIRAENLLLLPVGPLASDAFQRNVLSKMNGDEVYLQIRRDAVITLYGEHEYARLRHSQKGARTVIDRCRELSRMVLAAKKMDGSVTCLRDLLTPSRYKLVRDAVRNVAKYNEEQNSFQIPTLVLKLGHSIRRSCVILQAENLQDEILHQEVSTIDNFLTVMTAKWSVDMATNAHRNLKSSRCNRPLRLPVTEDIQKLNRHLTARSEVLTSLIQKQKNTDEQKYFELVEVLLVQVLTLNRRRPGEIQYMTTHDFQAAQSVDQTSDIYNSLSSSEKELSKGLIRLVIKGKRERGVPVILTRRLQDGLILLVEKRNHYEIPVANTYLFPSKRHVSGHYRAHDLLKKYAKAANCSAPDTLTSTKLRKHIATTTQLLNLKENELDSIAKFMGHDIRVHREYYRLADQTVDLAKISKLLISLEKGQLKSLKGKSLDEIDIEGDRMSDDPEEDDDPPVPDERQKKRRALGRLATVNIEDVNKDYEPKDSDSSDDSSLSSDEPTKRKQKISKRPWTESQKQIIREVFKNYITTLAVPQKKAIDNCLKEYKEEFGTRTWRNIKDYVYNCIKDKKKRC